MTPGVKFKENLYSRTWNMIFTLIFIEILVYEYYGINVHYVRYALCGFCMVGKSKNRKTSQEETLS